MYSKILGTGSYLPSQVRTNADLEKMVDTSDEWIVTRTGIKERRIAAENETVADMGYIAAKNAIEMAGIDSLETVQKVDGQSFVSVLKGETYDGARPLFWHYPNEWGPSGPGIGAASTVRKGNWKLIYYHADRSMELFNLKDDIGETNNLVEANPEKLKDLATTLTNHLKGVNAQMPIDKETEEVVPFPLEVLQPKIPNETQN